MTMPLQGNCHFCTTISKEELHTIWNDDDKQVQSLINKYPVRKASVAASTALVRLAEVVIKNFSVTAKDCISRYMEHI